jgi:hypothetical protein
MTFIQPPVSEDTACKKESARRNRHKKAINKEPFPNTVGARLNAFYFPTLARSSEEECHRKNPAEAG